MIHAGRPHHPDDAASFAIFRDAEDTEGFAIVGDDPAIDGDHDAGGQEEEGVWFANGQERVGRSHLVAVARSEIVGDVFQPCDGLLWRGCAEVVEFNHDLLESRCYQFGSGWGLI